MNRRITQTDYPNNVTVLEAKCPFCHKTSKLTLPTSEWLKGLHAYKNGAVAQDAWPKLSPSQRELIITGICDKCWESL